MKKIDNYIQEKLKINKSVIDKNKNTHTLFPKTRTELTHMIAQEIAKNGNECSLNHIDVSKINSLEWLFYNSNFDGDISEWDVSNVKDMNSMFSSSTFTGKNSDLSSWDISNVDYMTYMFEYSNFNSDLSAWNIPEKCNTGWMFYKCEIEDKYLPYQNNKKVHQK